jgi:catechol 2,3-dioxygenase-like lactoylglutathione lyase family enzyme
MKFRSARHTDNLPAIITFYTEALGLTVLGNFKDHDGYDGVFLGLAGADWHLEFTASNEPANHQPDEDDLLVFYPASAEEYAAITERFAKHNIPPAEPKNTYWKVNGTLYKDPDGFGVMIVKTV